MSTFTVALYPVLLLIAILVLYWGLSLLRNYLAVRKLGVPIRIIPIDHTNPIWMLIGRSTLAILKRVLPFLSGTSFARYNFRGWEIGDRYRTHQELGDVFVMVTPGRNWLYLADPDALMDVFRRRTDFPRCLELTEVLNVFGPNISTVDGPQWKMQRKLIGTCFTEKNNQIVWSASTAHAQAMLQDWTTKPSVDTIAPDMRLVSLNILVRAGFGESATSKLKRDDGHSHQPSNFQQSLQTILENCILIMALGPSFLADWKAWLPHNFVRLHEACAAFQTHMTDLYEAEKRRSSPQDHNIMTSLVRASQVDSQSGSGGLTEQEIYANMFVLNFAGHDTTAHAFTFSLYLLAAHPTVQDWIAEELRRVLGDRPPSEWDYTRDFPRLKRCLAVMYETLRLWTPVPVAKWTDTRPQTLVVDRWGDGNKTTLVLPPRTMVIPAYAAVQSNPRYWGPDALTWRPERWVRPSSSSISTCDTDSEGRVEKYQDEDEFIPPKRGTFLGWSEGARDCPGRKFSQVEFVATMAVLFRDWRVDPVVLEGEGDVNAARERVLGQIEDDSAPVLLLQMLHPERSPLVWRRRD